MVAIVEAQVVGADLVERWRDLGPVVWIVAAAVAAGWFVALGMVAAALDPRRVSAGPATLDHPGDEPPAVVNLLTNDWDLGHAAIPATLLDLAGRGFVAIDQVGDRTFVRIRANPPASPSRPLTHYDGMVLGHLRGLAAGTTDGVVPAQALTTGPTASSKDWWESFSSAVVHDARSRDLSRPRWSPPVKLAFVIAAAVVAATVALAMTTLRDDPNNSEDSPVGAAPGVAILTFGALSGLVASRGGERDTPKGREVASRWLGVRNLLAQSSLFAEQSPAAVVIWDQHLGHGAALGVAHGAVRALPLGAESETEAWSSVGGRWRVVRVRYPKLIPPGYGRHPALMALVGWIVLGIGLPLLDIVPTFADSALDSLRDDAFSGDVPTGLRIAVPLVAAVGVAICVSASVVGAAMILTGIGDLLRGRTEITGRVLRLRERGSEEKTYWYVAVDDGTSTTVRAWRVKTLPQVTQGATVQALVTPALSHVRELRVVPLPPVGTPALSGDETGV
jgi:hypothetical protein